MAGARRKCGAELHAVALTFDDGPDQVYTPAILEVLRELGVKATFFMVGARAEKYPDLVRSVVREGHAIGSHSMTHPDMWELPLRRAVSEYRTAREVLQSIAGRPVRLFRPPKGSLIPSQALAIRALGFHPWLWSIDPGDWEVDASPSSIVGGLGDLGEGDVILLHDAIERPIQESTTDRSATVSALPAIVEAVRRRGLGFATLS